MPREEQRPEVPAHGLRGSFPPRPPFLRGPDLCACSRRPRSRGRASPPSPACRARPEGVSSGQAAGRGVTGRCRRNRWSLRPVGT